MQRKALQCGRALVASALLFGSAGVALAQNADRDRDGYTERDGMDIGWIGLLGLAGLAGLLRREDTKRVGTTVSRPV
jgi:MYXO-CTERM domain-containing protein